MILKGSEFARAQLHDLGFVIVADVVAAAECMQVAYRLDRPAEGRTGTRVLLKEAWCREFAATIRRHPGIAALLTADLLSQCL